MSNISTQQKSALDVLVQGSSKLVDNFSLDILEKAAGLTAGLAGPVAGLAMVAVIRAGINAIDKQGK